MPEKLSFSVQSLDDHLHTVLQAHPEMQIEHKATLVNVSDILMSLQKELEDNESRTTNAGEE